MINYYYICGVNQKYFHMTDQELYTRLVFSLIATAGKGTSARYYSAAACYLFYCIKGYKYEHDNTGRDYTSIK